jgi:hypothetical protein
VLVDGKVSRPASSGADRPAHCASSAADAAAMILAAYSGAPPPRR